MKMAEALMQSDFKVNILSVHVYPGNQTQYIAIAITMLYCKITSAFIFFL